MQQKTVYIAGAVTGLPPEAVEAKFKKKQQELQAQGYYVVNPVEFMAGTPLARQPWEAIMRWSITTMLEAEELHLLPCWNTTKDAPLLRDIAMRLGMPIVYC